MRILDSILNDDDSGKEKDKARIRRARIEEMMIQSSKTLFKIKAGDMVVDHPVKPRKEKPA